jgi:hypothetical protein
LLSVLFAGEPARADDLEASLRAFAGLELDDRVLAGPAYGYGADAFVRVAGAVSVGAYAEWREAFYFSETSQVCEVGDCDRNEVLLGVLVKGSLELRPDVWAWFAGGAGYRRHEWITSGSFDSENGSIVSRGIDVLKLVAGFDFRLGSFLKAGPYFDWAFGCFYESRRHYESGQESDLGGTCSGGPPYVSTGLGLRAGFFLE